MKKFIYCFLITLYATTCVSQIKTDTDSVNNCKTRFNEKLGVYVNITTDKMAELKDESDIKFFMILANEVGSQLTKNEIETDYPSNTAKINLQLIIGTSGEILQVSILNNRMKVKFDDELTNFENAYLALLRQKKMNWIPAICNEKNVVSSRIYPIQIHFK